MKPPYEKMFCLVGENPLPVYLGILQLAADKADVVLLSSRQTEPQATNIKTVIKRMRPSITCRINPGTMLSDPHNPSKVQTDIAVCLKQISGKPEDYALNYTGGTKVMSAYGLMAWGGAPRNSFYLEDSDAIFWLGDGTPTALDIPPRFGLNLSNLFDLHGVVPGNRGSAIFPTADDLSSLWAWFRHWLIGRHDERVNDSERGWLAKLSSASDQARFAMLKNDLLPKGKEWSTFISHVPGAGLNWYGGPAPQTYGAYKSGYRCRHALCEQVEFATGGWLENLVHEAVKSLELNSPIFDFGAQPGCPLVPTGSDHISLQHEFRVSGQLFECDVIATAHNRLYYFSVTTGNSQNTVKGKMFEAKARAEQIGGGLARAAVVAPISDEDRRACISSVGDSRHRFFGWEDIDHWISGDAGEINKRQGLWDFMTGAE